MRYLLKYLLVIVIIFIPNFSEAQVTRPPYFDTCQSLQPLEGEWMNVNGADTIRIYLRFHRNFYSDPETFNSTVDELWGWMEYKQGSTVIMSDYVNRMSILPYNVEDVTPGLRSIVIWQKEGCVYPQLKLAGGLTDLIRCNQNKRITATVTPQGTQMTWHIVQPPAVVDNVWCAGYTLPQQFTLIKQ